MQDHQNEIIKRGPTKIYYVCFSVPVPFNGEYVKLSNNKKWKKTTNNAPVIWADWVSKINRKNGKVIFNYCSLSYRLYNIVPS